MDPETQVNAYLTVNKGRLQYSTIDLIVFDVKTFGLYGMSPLSDDEIRKLVVRWASFNAVGLLLKPSAAVAGSPAPGPGARSSISDAVDAVKKAITVVSKGVTLVGDDNGNVVIGVSGLTANLKQGDMSASLGISWGQTLTLKAESGILHFSGSLSKDHWEMSLTFPKDSAVPNTANLQKIFTEGEKAIRNIATATASFQNINDATKVGALIKPHIAAVEDAVEAASGIADAEKKGGMSFGVKFSSPDPGPGDQGGIPRGVQGQVTVTWWF
jgi:hypothetical protein